MIVADVGNTSLCIAEFADEQSRAKLPAPDRIDRYPVEGLDFQEIQRCLPKQRAEKWIIGSVNDPAARTLTDWIESCRGEDRVYQVTHKQINIATQVDTPHEVGIDRLAAAWAATTLRNPEHAAIVIDAGTAFTIDLVSMEGNFAGGLIYPGLKLSLSALARGTSRLPELGIIKEKEDDELVGTNTESAMRAGVYWAATCGAAGIVEMMLRRYGPADLFLTGGTAPMVLPYLPANAQHVPHLVLAGLAMTAQSYE